MSFEFDDDDEEVARARFDRLTELLDVVRANTKEINEIAVEIREDTSRRREPHNGEHSADVSHPTGGHRQPAKPLS